MCIKKGNFYYCALAGCHYANHDCSIAPSRAYGAQSERVHVSSSSAARR